MFEDFFTDEQTELLEKIKTAKSMKELICCSFDSLNELSQKIDLKIRYGNRNRDFIVSVSELPGKSDMDDFI